MYRAGSSAFFKVELAVAAAVISDLGLVVYARAHNGTIFLLITAADPARAVLVPEFCLVPDQPTDDGGKLFFIGVEYQVVFPCVGTRPFQHILFSSMLL